MLKSLILAAALAFTAESALADPPSPASAQVKLSDLNLDLPADQTRLRLRFALRIAAICGHPSTTALTYVNTGSGRVQRYRCVEALTISSTDPRVNAQFQLAKLR